jgi:hypothetical protein
MPNTTKMLFMAVGYTGIDRNDKVERFADDSRAKCEAWLDRMISAGKCIGGGLNEYVSGIGYVVSD